jgi:glycolate oxidase FAD binding subunit
LLIGFEDDEETVRWQVEHIAHELAIGENETLWGNDGLPTWNSLTAFSAHASSMTIKVNLLPSAFESVRQHLPEAWPVQCHAGNGIVIAHAPGDLTLDRAQTMLGKLQEAAAATHGNAVVLRCPPEWKKQLPIWGRPRGDIALMRAVKERLDPQRLFNPGRFVAGI